MAACACHGTNELDLEGAGAGALHTSKVAASGAPERADGARWGVVATHKQIGGIYYMHVIFL